MDSQVKLKLPQPIKITDLTDDDFINEDNLLADDDEPVKGTYREGTILSKMLFILI